FVVLSAPARVIDFGSASQSFSSEPLEAQGHVRGLLSAPGCSIGESIDTRPGSQTLQPAAPKQHQKSTKQNTRATYEMIATSVYDYLEPYLPTNVVYGISMVVFVFEKFFMPKFYQLYTHASLDPKSLVPFVISAIALYLSIVSIYHAIKAALRTVWFLIKWSVFLISIWLILGFLNQVKEKSEGGQSGKNIFESYQKSATSWFNSAPWSAANLDPNSFIGPLQLIFGQSLVSLFDPLKLFEPMFNHFQSQSQGSGSFRPGTKSSSSSSRSSSKTGNHQHGNPQKSRTAKSNDNTEQPNVREFLKKFWT
ncbi:hypothetical protein MJO28_000514, partial [Puccinia striiformis f. sp. tritici]